MQTTFRERLESLVLGTTGVDGVQPVGPVRVVIQDVQSHFIVQSIQGRQVHLASLKTVWWWWYECIIVS